MYGYSRPTVLVSKCLTDEICRYNSQKCTDDEVLKYSNFMDMIPVCPETGIGLKTPRNAVRLVKNGKNIRLLQLSTGEDFTDTMLEFAKNFFTKLPEIDGFILKGRSPSCGTGSVKVYKDISKGASICTGKGLFASYIIERYTGYPIEEEGRLKSFRIREHFLTKLYTLCDFKRVKKSKSINELINFHSRNKLLLMTYNQLRQKELGRIIASYEKKNINTILDDYEKSLRLLFLRMPRYTSNINAMHHAFGYFSENISSDEKTYLLDMIEKYREGKVPLSVPISLIKYEAIRFNIEYILMQTYFQPYPEELVTISDSGKGIER